MTPSPAAIRPDDAPSRPTPVRSKIISRRFTSWSAPTGQPRPRPRSRTGSTIAPASVTGMVRRLADQGLLKHEPYRGVRLTKRASASRSGHCAAIG